MAQELQRIERSLFDELKQNNEDFEFYPTTLEILRKITEKKFALSDVKSILDIGCGNGKALDYFRKNWQHDNLKLFGIEKSQILISNLINPDILIVGNDFSECMLLDKQVDMIFSNPPYKEFKEWTLKILTYTIANKVVLVIPDRWRRDEEIKSCLKECGWSDNSIGFFDFLNSEDRKARANVEVVMFSRSERSENVFERELAKSFNMGDLFKDLKKGVKFHYEHSEEIEKDCKDIVSAKDLIDYLLGRYHAEQSELYKNLDALSSVGASLLSDLGVKKSTIIDATLSKIKGLKNIYWEQILNRTPEISKRLTIDQRRDFLRELADRGAEFTRSNILGVILFAINTAKKCERDNFIAYWERLSSYEFRKKYKSNEKAFGNSHRYEKPEKIHEGKLDYRIVVNYAGDFYSRMDYLHHCKVIEDLQVIARSLGYDGDLHIVDKKGEDVPIVYCDLVLPLGESFAKIGDTTLARCKVFQNRNLHIFFDQKFLAKLNLNVFSHLGWIKTKEEAKQEFKKDLSESEIEDFFNMKNIPLSLEIL